MPNQDVFLSDASSDCFMSLHVGWRRFSFCPGSTPQETELEAKRLIGEIKPFLNEPTSSCPQSGEFCWEAAIGLVRRLTVVEILVALGPCAPLLVAPELERLK